MAIIGDGLHSRVARSNIFGLNTMGSEVWLAGPTTLMPNGFAALGAHVTRDIREALDGADVVMGLRIQRERQKGGLFPSAREYAAFYGIGLDELKLAKPGALVMHPGPMNRGVEMSSYAADCEQSVIREDRKSVV